MTTTSQENLIPLHQAHRNKTTYANLNFTAHIGLVIFLGSWTMMFAGLFFIYLSLRARQPIWPPENLPHLPLALPIFNSLFLVASSLALSRALKFLPQGLLRPVRRYWLGAVLLGLLFMILQSYAWHNLWNLGLTLRSGVYGSTFYLLTCFHALHIVVGLGLLLWLSPPIIKLRPLTTHAARMHLVSWFWHFMGIVWLVIFVSVYIF